MKRLFVFIGLLCSVGMAAEIHLPDSVWTFRKKGAHHHVEQNEIWLSSDQPGVGSEVLDKGHIQWETGFEVAHLLGAHDILLPNSLFRFGVHEKIEVRLEYGGLMTINDKPVSAQQWQTEPLYQPAYLHVGSKFQICEHHGGAKEMNWIPRVALLLNAGLPVTSAMVKEMPVYGGAYLLLENEVLEWLSISYDAGVHWVEWAPIPDIESSVGVNFVPTDRLGLFAEVFGIFNCDAVNEKKQLYTDSNIHFNVGITYAVHPRVQVDMYGGFNLYSTNTLTSGPRNYSFLGLGVTWLIWHP